MKIGFVSSSWYRSPAGAFGLLLALILVVTLVVPVLAADPPAQPMNLYGAVTIDGAQAPEGTQVYAVMDGTANAIGAVDALGLYGSSAPFRVQGTPAQAGHAVTFYVGGTPGTGTGGTLATTDPASVTYDPGSPLEVAVMIGAVQQYTLTVSTTSCGTVTAPGLGNHTYAAGTSVPLLAVPDQGCCFTEWTGDTVDIASTTAASTTIIMNGDYSITANFVSQVVLTTASGAGGSVTDPGEGDNSYCPGEVVPIVATPGQGYEFVNWTGDTGTVAETGVASTTITMNASYSVMANFNFVGSAQLTVTSGDGGSVTTPPEGGSPYTYTLHQVVPIVATPDTGYEFVDWTGDTVDIASTTAASTTITMDDDYAIQANFQEVAGATYTLTVSSGTGGTVTTPGVGTFGPYAADTVVNLSATAAACYQFSSWTGNVANNFSATTTVTMTQNQSVTANFSYTCGGGGGGGYIPPSPTATPAVTPTAAPTPSPTPAGTPPPIPSEEEIDLSGNIDGSGVVHGDVTFSGFGDTIGVTIGDGTTALTEGGEPLSGITIEEVCFGYPAPPAGAYVIGCAYDYQPDGATFDPPITITLKYDDGNLPPGVAEADLVMAMYKAGSGTWLVLPSTVDTVNNVVTAQVSNFCYFAVYYAPPQPTPTATPVVPTPTATPTPAPAVGGGANVGAIVGGIIGALIVIAIIVFVMRRRGKGGAAPAGGPPK